MQPAQASILDSERHVRESLSRLPLTEVGSRLRAKRCDLGISIRDLAKQAMVSKTSIVNIEAGKSCRPSTLVKVSVAMGLHVDRFLKASEGEPPVTVQVHRRKDDRWYPLDAMASGPVASADSTELRQQLFSNGSGPLMLMFQNIPLEAGFVAGIVELASASAARTHPGMEWVYVLSGRAEVTVAAETYDLHEKESILFAGSVEHAYSPHKKGDPVTLFIVRRG